MVDKIKAVTRIKDIHSGSAKLLQLEVGRVLAAIKVEQDCIAELQEKITAVDNNPSVTKLANRASWVEFNQQRIQACRTRIAELEEQHRTLQSQWHEAERQTEAMDTLLASRKAVARREQERKDILEADEIVGRGYRGIPETDS